MAGINDYSNTAGSNTTINGIDIAEGCSPAGINNAIRQLMADIADVDDGVVPLQTPDINGGTIDGATIGGSSTIDSSIIGGTTPAAGTFTTLTANTSITGTLNTAAQPNITSLGTLTSATISGDLTVDTDTLYVDSTNNRVGIGTTSPSYNLDVLGQTGSLARVRIQNNGTSASDSSVLQLGIAGTTAESLIYFANPSDANVGQIRYDHASDYLSINVNATERMRIDSSGNVGIGTTSPSNKTHITSSVSGTTPVLRVENSNSDGLIGFKRTSGTPSDDYVLGADSTRMYFRNNTTSTDLISILEGGNVGIGTTSPNEILEVLKSGGGHIRLSETSARYVEITGYAEGTANGSTMAFSTIQSGTSTLTERMRTDSNGDVSIGTTSPQAKLHIVKNDAGALNDANSNMLMIENTTATGMCIGSSPTGEGHIYFSDSADADVGAMSYFHTDNSLRFRVNASERMRIGSSGNLLIAKSSSSFGTAGVELNVGDAKYNQFTRSGGGIVDFNRLSDDGEILAFHQDSNKEGTISVSGATVSYNGFTGTHWSRLSDNSKPTILKGTILESLDEMMNWYQVQFDITETDDEGNETTITQKESYTLGNGESVGDVITYNYEGTDYQATIIQEGDVKHTKSKISDTVDAKNVYGVFMDWDNDDDTVNDMYVAQTGTFVVRMNSAETVSKGDLIQSNGDGTGKVQADDIIRSSTVAKVLSTTKIETYDDGSYIVPCSLHC